MIFYVIFGDFVGWDWGTPAILQQKHPWTNWIKIWDWQIPPPSVGTKTKIFPKIQFEGSPKGTPNWKRFPMGPGPPKGTHLGNNQCNIEKAFISMQGKFFLFEIEWG